MGSTPRSLRQEQRELAAELRAKQRTWPQISREFSAQYGLNMRTALRLVRDWSQRDAAEQWNRRWPADPKTFKNFSYWELWPGPTGHAPSLDTLACLAELYECSLADLVSDCADFRSRDPAHRDANYLGELYDIAAPDEAGASRLEGSKARYLLEKFEMVDVQEMARLAARWSEQVAASASRRALLLKLSAALSLAAASPASTDEQRMDGRASGSVLGEYSGMWHSSYVYPSTGRGDNFSGEHYIVVRQNAERLIAQSVPQTSGSQLKLELAVSGAVATGTWRETTSPTGYYRGAVYHGTLQMVIDPSGCLMRGMWLGFGRDFTINSGTWELAWRESSTAKNAQKRYHLEA